MFKKTMIPVKEFAKKAISSKSVKSMALMLLVGCGAALTQNSAGDYTAGTTALTTVTEEDCQVCAYSGQTVLCHSRCGCRCGSYLSVYQHEQ